MAVTYDEGPKDEALQSQSQKADARVKLLCKK